MSDHMHAEQPTALANIELSTTTDPIVSRLLLTTAISEGSSGYWDDCGPCANCMVGRVNHLLPESAYNGLTIEAIRERDIVAGRFTAGGGQTLDDIRWDIETHSHHQHIQTYIPFAQPGNWDAIHTALKEQSGTNAIVLQLLNAMMLPGNEQGVRSHFVTVAGIHSILGYFILNGDDVQAAVEHRTYYPGRWVTAAQLIPANVAGLISVARNPNEPWV